MFFGFPSFTVPPSVFTLDLTTRHAEPWGRVEADVDADAYRVEQVRYPSQDGTPVTMFLVHHKRARRRDGNNPTLLYGYGGFNISLTPAFGRSSLPVPGARRRAAPWPTCAAAASTARTGTGPACSATSRTSSTTSSPPPSG